MSSPSGEPRTSTGDFSASIGGLYLHIPFCVKRCAYCDFASSSVGSGSRDRIHAYAQSLSRLIRGLSSLGLLENLRTAYIGGGTPTVLGEDLPRLIESVTQITGTPQEAIPTRHCGNAAEATEPAVARWAPPYMPRESYKLDIDSCMYGGAHLATTQLSDPGLGSLSDGQQSQGNSKTRLSGSELDSCAPNSSLLEVTFEANPDSSSLNLLEKCRKAGAMRVSIGVQSTDDAVLGKLGRLHDCDQALQAIGWAREAGLRVSADLMAGVPGQTEGAIERDVARLAESGVGHVSVYALEVHESTPFGELEARGLLDAPGEDETADLLEEAEHALRARGFERYEVSNYAKPGEESLHNLLYWTGVPYLGLSPSAASMLTGDLYRKLQSANGSLPDLPDGIVRARLTCTSSIDDVIGARTFDDLRFDVEGLDERQAIAEDLMLAARLAEGIPPALAERAREVIGPDVDATLSELVDDGLLSEGAGAFRPTERGWLLGNVLYGDLWALAGDSETWTG